MTPYLEKILFNTDLLILISYTYFTYKETIFSAYLNIRSIMGMYTYSTYSTCMYTIF